jgi:hypothetical protein
MRTIEAPDGEAFDVPDLIVMPAEAALNARGIFPWCPDCGEFLWAGPTLGYRAECPECGWPKAEDWPPAEYGDPVG